MATIGQYYYKVTDVTTGEEITTSGFDPVNNEISGPFSKISFQAPAATEITLTDSRGNVCAVVVGRAGYYEVPEEIIIQKFKMKAGTIYNFSKTEATEELKQKIQNEVTALEGIVKTDGSINENYTSVNYEDLYDTYTSLLGDNAVEVSLDLNNVIIDFIKE